MRIGHDSLDRPRDQSVASVKLVDLFSGAGGLSYGFRQLGFSPVVGVDADPNVAFAYEHNNAARFECSDIREMDGKAVREWFDGAETRILGGCAPCQPFSTYNQARNKEVDDRLELSAHMLRLIDEVKPELVVSENVAAYASSKEHDRVVAGLKASGYWVFERIVDAYELGVPQHRQRFVLVASRLGELHPMEWPARKGPKTVREAIGWLPALRAGQTDPHDPLHVAPRLSDINLSRIRASIPGGTWRDWPDDLVVMCHRRGNGPKYPSIYGRMEWDRPAPTITTQAYNYGSGRFGHPEQDRAISLREAALFQGFPAEYSFVPRGEEPYFRRVGPMIGNAVPVPVARWIARSVREHLVSVGRLTAAGLENFAPDESDARSLEQGA